MANCEKCGVEIKDTRNFYSKSTGELVDGTVRYTQHYYHKACPVDPCPRCGEPLGPFEGLESTMTGTYRHKGCQRSAADKARYAAIQAEALDECKQAEAQSDEDWGRSLFA